MRALSAGFDTWRLRARTTAAMLLLLRARMTIALVPLRWWRKSLGLAGPAPDADQRRETRRLAIHVERAAAKLPGSHRCLAQAMALSALLRRARLAHAVVIAVRPSGHPAEADRLHAWVEQAGVRVIGDLPGPWIETLRLGGEAR